MDESTIQTQKVILSATGKAVEVIAQVLQRQVHEGMFLRIPFNNMIDLTVAIEQAVIIDEDHVRLFLDCDGDPELVLAFHFNDESLKVTSEGEH